MPRSARMISKRCRTAPLCEAAAPRGDQVISGAVPGGDQPVLRRQGQFDPASATADDRQAHMTQILRAFEQRFPARGETVDRLDGDGMLGPRRHIGRAAASTRHQGTRHRSGSRVAAAYDAPRRAVETDRLVMDQPRAGEPREAHQIDMAFAEPVKPGDIPGSMPE